MKGSLKKRSDGTWTLRYDLPRDNGRRRQRTVTFKGTAKQAQAELAKLIHEVETGRHATSGGLTVAAFLEDWLRHKQQQLAAATFEDYQWRISKYVNPSIGHIRLDALRPLHLQRWYDEELAAGRSIYIVNYNHRIIRSALTDAVRWQLMAVNPAKSTSPPRLPRVTQKTIRIDAARAVVDAARGTRYFAPVLLALWTGMRRSEILGLRWQDVDLDKGLLLVRQSLIVTMSNQIVFKSPKTRSSRRPIALSIFAIAGLREQKQIQAQDRADALAKGKQYLETELVCTQADGRPVLPSSFTHALPRLLKQAGLERVRLHDLRHTHATGLALAGVPLKVISDRLGHSSISITADIYSHVLPEMQADAAEQWDEITNKSEVRGDQSVINEP